MSDPTHNKKRIIWESKRKQIVVIAGAFLFVAIALYAREKCSPLLFWTTMIFFGGGGLSMLLRLINPNNVFVTPDTPLGKQILLEQFKETEKDPGVFEYTSEGFSLKSGEEIIHTDWSDIETIFGYKQDRYTTDEICMDIFLNNETSLQLTESTPGWYQFNKQLSEAIPAISEHWYVHIIHPPFATNMTLVFDKRNRAKEEVEKECYRE